MGEQQKRHSAGWYAGAAAFWLLCAWMVTVGLSSIIPQIFGPARADGSQQGSCKDELLTLEQELLERTGTSMTHAYDEAERQELLAWLASWDQRLIAARPSCTEKEQPAWAELSRLRHGMQGLIERFDREEAPKIRKLEKLLGADPEARAP